MAVLIRDVANRAGVSTATVSRVLSDPTDVRVAEGTRDHVRRVAAEMGYRPSAAARALVRRRTDTVGILLPSTGPEPAIGDAFFSALLSAILPAATLHRLDTMVYTGFTGKAAEEDLNRFADGRCDGLVFFYQPSDSGIVSAVLEAGIPAVMVSDRRDDPRLSWVDVDNVAAGREMTEYLLRLGHRRIAFFNSLPEDNSYVALRTRGYRDALAAHGVPEDPALIRFDACPWDPEALESLVADLMARPPRERPTGFCCTGDDIAGLVMAALARLGWRVPEEVSVVGFNDDPTAARLLPPLTTMRQPYHDLAARTLDLLAEQMSDISCRGQQVVLPATLVVRASSGPPDVTRQSGPPDVTRQNRSPIEAD